MAKYVPVLLIIVSINSLIATNPQVQIQIKSTELRQILNTINRYKALAEDVRKSNIIFRKLQIEKIDQLSKQNNICDEQKTELENKLREFENNLSECDKSKTDNQSLMRNNWNLSIKLQSLENKVQALEENNRNLQASIESKDGELSEKIELEKKLREFENNLSEYDKSKTDNQSLMRNNWNLSIKLQSLENKVQALEENNRNLQASIENKDGELSEKIAEISELITNKNNTYWEQLQTIQGKDEQIRELNAQVSKLSLENYDLKSREDKSKRDFNLLSNNYTNLQTNLQNHIIQLQNDQIALHELNNRMLSNNTHQQEKYTALQKQKNIIENKYTLLEAKQSEISRSCSECSNKNSELTSNLTRLNEMLDKKKLNNENCPAFGKFGGTHNRSVEFTIPCNSEKNEHAWTVVERRHQQVLPFNRSWSEYRDGFGDFQSEFFIGLEKLHLLTSSQPHELYIRLSTNKNTNVAIYSHFVVAGESQDYAITSLGKYDGDAGDGMRPSEGQKFTTYDRDNDQVGDDVNCATDSNGGWWFKECNEINLNIKFYNDFEKMFLWNNAAISYELVEIFIRPLLVSN